MQMLTMCESRPGTLADKHTHGLLHGRLRQTLISSKKGDMLLISDVRVPNFLSEAQIKVNILRGQTVVPHFE
jgi:hypothetical protein